MVKWFFNLSLLSCVATWISFLVGYITPALITAGTVTSYLTSLTLWIVTVALVCYLVLKLGQRKCVPVAKERDDQIKGCLHLL